MISTVTLDAICMGQMSWFLDVLVNGAPIDSTCRIGNEPLFRTTKISSPWRVVPHQYYITLRHSTIVCLSGDRRRRSTMRM